MCYINPQGSSWPLAHGGEWISTLSFPFYLLSDFPWGKLHTLVEYIYILLLAIIVFIVWHYPCRDVSKCLLTLNRELIVDESKDTTKIHLGESINFIGVTGIWVRNYLPEQKWLWQLHHRSTLARGIFHGSWNLEHTEQRIGNLTGWRVSFWGIPFFLSLF